MFDINCYFEKLDLYLQKQIKNKINRYDRTRIMGETNLTV